MQNVSEKKDYRISSFNMLKLNFYKIYSPLYKILALFRRLFSLENLIIIFYFLVLFFGRSFTGVYIFGFRLGELLIGGSLITITYYLVFRTSKITTFFGSKVLLIFRFLFIHFIYITLNSGSIISLLNPQVYRSSSYIWSLGFIFTLLLFKKQNIFKVNLFFNLLIVSIPVMYILSTIYYPSPIQDYFNSYSDKFRLPKGSDLFLALSIFLIFIFEKLKDSQKLKIYLFFVLGTFIPLIFYASRGAALGTIILCTYLFLNSKSIFLKSYKFLLLYLIIFFSTLIISSIYLDTTEVDLGEIHPKEALSSVETTLVTKRFEERNLPFFFIENNRLVSGDGNLNWRLQIWQDVIQDLKSKKKLLNGYGYSDNIPAMEKIDRKGLDGTNIHVHNYFVNIFARGGLIQLILFLSFYLIILKKLYLNHETKKFFYFVLAVLVVSFFDSSMESVRFPFLFYTTLSYSLKS